MQVTNKSPYAQVVLAGSFKGKVEPGATITLTEQEAKDIQGDAFVIDVTKKLEVKKGDK